VEGIAGSQHSCQHLICAATTPLRLHRNVVTFASALPTEPDALSSTFRTGSGGPRRSGPMPGRGRHGGWSGMPRANKLGRDRS
jgi:hypothetical protein